MNRKTSDRGAIRRMVPRFLCLFLACAAAGQTLPSSAALLIMRRQSVPVAADIERSLLRTGMFLQFEARWYDVALNKFSASMPDESERACAAALEDIRTRNYAQFKSIWEIPPKPAASANEPSSGIQAGDSNAWLDGYHSAFDFEHVTMVARVLVGSHSVCVWDANAKSGPVRRAFIVRGDHHGAKVSAVTSDTKLEEVILNSLEAARRTPSAYKPVFDFHPRVQFPIPSEGNGSAGEHPVFLQFDGVPIDYDLAQKTPPSTSDPVIEFYQRAYAANSARNLEVLPSMFTPFSAAKLKEWTEKEQETERDKDGKEIASHAERAFLEPRYVKFVIHGDPVSLVFVSGDSGKAWHPEHLSYRYEVKDTASGQLQLANLGYNNALDQLLYSSLFDMRILRVPESKKPKPAAAPAKTKTGK
jgi:hypothetical protein